MTRTLLDKNMWAIRISYIIVSALAINHLIDGFGCWGLQAGGQFSAFLYQLQIITAAITALFTTIILIRSRPPQWQREILNIGLVIMSITGSFLLIGWRMMTSIHCQGMENLIPFLIATGGSVLLGRIYTRSADFRDFPPQKESKPNNTDA